MNSQQLKKIGLPDKPGVYFFKSGKSILYIGKATSLRDRVRSYFSKDLISTRGPMILDMTVKADNVEWQETDSVLESLILEANLIKKYKPKYNTKEKDNKSFNFVCITRDKLPRVLVVRGRGLNKKEYSKVYGPYPNGLQLREAMKIIRRIFPYIDNDSAKKNNTEFYKQLGLVPKIGNAPQNNLNFPRLTLKGSDADKNLNNFASLKEYKNNIKNLKLFFEGKKKSVVINLKKEMLSFAKKKEFEKAGEIKKRIFALEHINDIALIKDYEIASKKYENSSRLTLKGSDSDKNFHISIPLFRIEAYDVAHMGGKNMVGVMTVIENGEVNKGEYRKFIIRTQDGANDTGALEEVLSRRLRHTEWGLPSLVVVDGSTAQINVAKRVLDRYQFDIPIVGVVKDERHRPKAIIGDEVIIKANKKNILLANNESHRFSITFHKQKRNKSFLNKI
ncbi:MAG: GIY-YIG nuclease family protein [Candidatus Nomurabacteria bacterium]